MTLGLLTRGYLGGGFGFEPSPEPPAGVAPLSLRVLDDKESGLLVKLQVPSDGVTVAPPDSGVLPVPPKATTDPTVEIKRPDSTVKISVSRATSAGVVVDPPPSVPAADPGKPKIQIKSDTRSVIKVKK